MARSSRGWVTQTWGGRAPRRKNARRQGARHAPRGVCTLLTYTRTTQEVPTRTRSAVSSPRWPLRLANNNITIQQHNSRSRPPRLHEQPLRVPAQRRYAGPRSRKGTLSRRSGAPSPPSPPRAASLYVQYTYIHIQVPTTAECASGSRMVGSRRARGEGGEPPISRRGGRGRGKALSLAAQGG
ncbi:hypothetical protein BKA93DRAFT_34183 [Sparassis latifolia]